MRPCGLRWRRKSRPIALRPDIAQPPFAFINAFKPSGVSSTAFGSWVKRLAGADALGHWGTLDPGACGVLVLGLGKATRLFPLLANTRKRYVFELNVGARTNTGDATGNVIEQGHVPDGWLAALAKVVPDFVGPLEQVPPMHSAVKVQGRPLYRSARAGVCVERKSRPTHIYDLRVLPEPERVSRSTRLFVECAAGTYVRVLCEDVGQRLGLVAHMGALVRLSSGDFHAGSAALPQQLGRDVRGCFLNPLKFFSTPRIAVDESQARRFEHGCPIIVADPAAVRAAGAYDRHQELLVVFGEDELLGTARASEQQGKVLLSPVRVLAQTADEGAAKGASGGEANG
ncbi:MAG: tRNA pseudouridine(55) synthase TruB [Candidatus Eremiobacter antarcticus]|nr:tRNA pseudouridine(55) synthase TruB [Candidatus Eremiobacteraeota bacterium]MBC5807571.1 tRNA pseudouridine(55) synthase TruB [Candidatus Eremiobacteraeota bacterium]